MKEKISCSLDGELLAMIDEFRAEYPVIDSRSCFIEIACLCFLEYYEACKNFDADRSIIGKPSAKASSFIYYWIEKRCKMNGQTQKECRKEL